MGRRARRAHRSSARPLLIGGLVVTVLVALGIGFGVPFLPWSSDSAVADAEERVAALPGVVSVETELDHEHPGYRRHRHLTGDRPDGEVLLSVTVGATVEPVALARILDAARSSLHDDRLDEHIVSIVVVQQHTGRRIFDGWWHRSEPRPLSSDELQDIATLVLSLPDDAWLDLDPSTSEQGAFGVIGGRSIGELLDEVDGGFTLTVPVATDSAAVLLSESVRIADEAAALLDGPTAIELQTPDGMVVRTATSPAAISDALAGLATLVAALADSEGLRVDYEAELDWSVADGEVHVTPTVRVTIDLGGVPECDAAVASHDQLVTDVGRVLDAHDLEHTLVVDRCDAA